MKKQLILVGLLAVGYASAQTDKAHLGKVGINIMTPQATIDIRPNADNSQETATTNEGILTPKLSKTRVANIEDALLVEGTLVYVTDDASSPIAAYAGTNAKVAKITEKGYYYYNGVEWVKVAIGANATQYTGSTSVVLSGTSFQRAALTGDVTAAANSNATTIAPNAVTSAKIADGQVALADLAANSVDSSKIVDKSIVAADLNQMGATDGQVLKYNATTNTWAPAADANDNTTYTGSTSVALSGNSFQRAALTGDVTAAANSNATTIAPNAVTSAKIADGQVTLVDLAANSVDSSKIVDKSIVAADLNQMGATNGQVLKWDGTAWAPAADANDNTTYTGSTSVALSGNSFQRAALTGDVTAAANSNATTIAPNAVTSAKIADGQVALADLAANSVDSSKIVDKSIVAADLNQMGAANGQVLKWNGTAWAPAADANDNTTYTGSTSVALNGNSFQRAALTGDVTATANSNATTVARIQGRAVANTAPTNGQVLKWNGTAWAPAADANTADTSIYANNGTLTGARTVNMNGNNLLFTGTGNVGIGTTSPQAKLDVEGVVKGLQFHSISFAAHTKGHAALIALGARSGSFANPGYVQVSDVLGGFVARDFRSNKNATVSNDNSYGGSEIYMIATQNFTDTAKGSNMIFRTTPNGTKYSLERLRIEHNGNVGIGTEIPTEKLDVAGNIRANSVTQTSDARFKQEVQPISNATATLNGLRSVTYHWNKEGKAKGGNDALQYGFIAQEVEKVLPALVSTDAQGYKSVNYIGVIPILVKALQEKDAKIQELEARLEKLEKLLK